MKERITRLARGKVDDKIPQIEILQPKIEAVIPYGSSYQGEIQIRSTNRVSFRGLIYPGDSRIRMKQQYFAGEGAILAYEVKGKSLESGEDIEGKFSLITNGGEFTIPYRFTAGEPGGRKYGALAKLEDFAAFARTDGEAALKLFSSNEFVKLDFMQELGLQALYEGLRKGSSMDKAMEEFLYAAGAKKKLAFSADVREKTFLCEGKELTGKVTVRRTGWGHTLLNVTADAPFIVPGKNVLTEDDFTRPEPDTVTVARFNFPLKEKRAEQSAAVEPGSAAVEPGSAAVEPGSAAVKPGSAAVEPGSAAVEPGSAAVKPGSAAVVSEPADKDLISTASFEYRIIPDKLHAGRNYGKIRLEGEDYSTDFPVIVTVAETQDAKKKRETNASYDKNYVRMMRAYLELSYVKGGKEARIKDMRDAWNKMSELSLPDIYQRLWQIEIQMLEGKKERAASSVEAMQSEVSKIAKRDPDAYCFYIYLQMSLEGTVEARERFLRILDSYADKGYFSPTIAMLRMKAADPDDNKPKEALNRLREFFRQGLRSPFIYLEGCLIYNRFPNILHRLGEYELQTLWFGARHGCIEREVVLQAAGLSGDELTFRPLLYRTLVSFYERWHDKQVLKAICGILVKGDMRSSDYFKWFELGVKEDIQLTWLYDYYLYCLPENYAKDLPSELLLYFSYNSHADAPSRERLYGHVLRMFPEKTNMYKAYEVQITTYALDQLFKGRVNPELAAMYKRVLKPENVDRRIARLLPDILKSSLVATKTAARYAIVCCGELTGEKQYNLKNGRAVIPMYTESYRVLLADGSNNRYASRRFTVTPLFTKEEAAPLLNKCYEYFPDLPMLRLAACESYMRIGKYSEQAVRTLEAQLSAEGLRPIYQSHIVRNLIKIFSESDGEGEEQLLACVRSRSMNTKDRVFLTETLIEKRYIAEAVALVRQHGCGGIDADSLRRLASSWAEMKEANDPGSEDKYLTEVARGLFMKGMADKVILSWLCRYYNGLSCEMLAILKSSVDAGVARYDMAGRLLSQKIFSGDTDEIEYVFRRYVEDGPADELIVRAYFVMKCSDYLFNDIKIDLEVMNYIREKVRFDYPYTETPDVLKYAVLKDFSEKAELSSQDQRLCKELVEDCCRSSRVFAFFQLLGRVIQVPDELIDKTLIEYKGQSDDRPELHYRFISDDADPVQERLKPASVVPMLQSYEGIFMRPMMLFDHETMEFEIRIRRDGATICAYKGSAELAGDEASEEAAGAVSGKASDKEAGKAAAKEEVPENLVRVRTEWQSGCRVNVTKVDVPSDNRFHRFEKLLEKAGDCESEEWQAEVEKFARTDTLVKKLFGIEL